MKEEYKVRSKNSGWILGAYGSYEEAKKRVDSLNQIGLELEVILNDEVIQEAKNDESREVR